MPRAYRPSKRDMALAIMRGPHGGARERRIRKICTSQRAAAKLPRVQHARKEARAVSDNRGAEERTRGGQVSASTSGAWLRPRPLGEASRLSSWRLCCILARYATTTLLCHTCRLCIRQARRRCRWQLDDKAAGPLRLCSMLPPGRRPRQMLGRSHGQETIIMDVTAKVLRLAWEEASTLSSHCYVACLEAV